MYSQSDPRNRLIELDRYLWLKFPLEEMGPKKIVPIWKSVESPAAIPPARPPAEPVEPEIAEPVMHLSVPAASRERAFPPELKALTRDVLSHRNLEPDDLFSEISLYESESSYPESAQPEVTPESRQASGPGLLERAKDESGSPGSVPEASTPKKGKGESWEEPIIVDESHLDEAELYKPFRSTTTTGASDSVPVVRKVEIPWVDELRPPYSESLSRTLYRMYRTDTFSRIDYGKFLSFLLNKSGADGVACMMRDPEKMAYRVFLRKGVDDITKRNLYFALEDSYLNTSKKFNLLTFRDHEDDFFFKKRFGTDFFLRTEGALAINLSTYKFPGYLLLFYQDLKQCNVVEVLAELSEFIKETVTLLERFRREQAKRLEPNFVNADLTGVLHRIFRELSDNGKNPINVVHFWIPIYGGPSNLRILIRELCEEIQSDTIQEERLVMFPPNRLSLALKQTDPRKIVEHALEFAREHQLQLKYKIMPYPASGNNLFNYVHVS